MRACISVILRCSIVSNNLNHLANSASAQGRIVATTVNHLFPTDSYSDAFLCVGNVGGLFGGIGYGEWGFEGWGY